MTMLPPPQYDVPPSIPVIEHVMTYGQLQSWCDFLVKLEPGRFFRGCQMFEFRTTGKICLIWYLKDDAAAHRHELAHCNGWPKDHPDHYVVPPKPVFAVNAAPVSRPYDPDMWARATPLAPVITDTVFRAIRGPSLAPWPTTRSDEK